jgi:hypothetical protein
MKPRDYLRETILQPLPDGSTRIQWQSSFYPEDPAAEDEMREVGSNVFQRLTRQISLAAEYPVPALTRSCKVDIPSAPVTAFRIVGRGRTWIFLYPIPPELSE